MLFQEIDHLMMMIQLPLSLSNMTSTQVYAIWMSNTCPRFKLNSKRNY